MLLFAEPSILPQPIAGLEPAILTVQALPTSWPCKRFSEGCWQSGETVALMPRAIQKRSVISQWRRSSAVEYRTHPIRPMGNKFETADGQGFGR